MRKTIFAPAAAFALALGFVACDDSTAGPSDGTQVTVAFRAASQSVADRGFAASPADNGAGTLTLESVWLVVDEFRLEGDAAACDGEDPAPDCGKFEAPPHLLAVPVLEGETVTVLEQRAPPGTFTWLKFETKAVTGDPDVQAQIAAEGITDWPSDASLLLTGVFTPEGVAQGLPFRAFFDAEVKVVLSLPHPLVLEDGIDDERFIFIEVDPLLWFTNGDGTLIDLAALDYDATGEVHKLEVKLEDGFTKIEIES